MYSTVYWLEILDLLDFSESSEVAAILIVVQLEWKFYSQNDTINGF